MAEAMPFPNLHRIQNSRFLGRAKYALGRNDNLECSAAPARAPAAHTPVATPVPRHDAAAEAAAGRVAHVDDAGERVGGVNGAGSRLPRPRLRTPHTRRCVLASSSRKLRA